MSPNIGSCGYFSQLAACFTGKSILSRFLSKIVVTRESDRGNGLAHAQKVVVSHSELQRMRREAYLVNNFGCGSGCSESAAVDIKCDPAENR